MLNKTNRRGRYWLLPDNNIRNFSDKYEREIIKIKKMKGYKKKINLRNEEIKQFLI